MAAMSANSHTSGHAYTASRLTPALRQAIPSSPWISYISSHRGHCIISACLQSSAAFICFLSLPFQDPVQFSTFAILRSALLSINLFSLPSVAHGSTALGKQKEEALEDEEDYMYII